MSRKIAFMTGVALLMPALAFAETRTFDVATFDEIEVTSGIKARVAIGEPQSVRVEYGSEEDAKDLEVVVTSGKLSIGLDRGFLESLGDWFSDGTDITAYVTVPRLTGVESSSGASVIVETMSGHYLSIDASSGSRVVVETVAGEEVEIEGSSGAAVDAAGSCGNLSVEASSGAHVDLARLQCRDVRVDASSGAGASVHATGSIDADASSGAGIEVRGKPDKIDIDTSSGGGIDFEND